MALSADPHGRRVIVTGAAGGIGRAIVEALSACGCSVAACDVPGAPLTELRGAGAAYEFDVRDRLAVVRGVGEAVEALGGCDAVIANAGIVDTIRRAERFPEPDWHKDLDTNLSGAFYPGITTLQRTPRDAHSPASVRASPTSPAFDAP